MRAIYKALIFLSALTIFMLYAELIIVFLLYFVGWAVCLVVMGHLIANLIRLGYN